MENKEIERSIIKRYRKTIFSPFIKALQEFSLIGDHDKIAVCISGGKDSFLLAKCMQEIKKHGKIAFDLEFIVMNPGYQETNLNKIKENLQKLEIDAHIFETPVFDIADKTDNPCYMCAKMRRGYLYSYAKELGCNKIALGHHFNDVIETVLLNMIFTGNFSSMPPKVKSDHFEQMELIRPLYYVHEEDIIKWAKSNELEFLDCACSVTKKNAGKRVIIKKLVNDLNDIYEKADINILTSTKKVNVNTILGYKRGNEYHNFNEEYEWRNQ